MNRINVATFNSRPPAEVLLQRLRANQIAAEMHDELKLEKFWFASRAESGFRIEVPADQFEAAHSLTLQSDEALRSAIRCPECKSLRVSYPQFTRRSILPNFFVGILVALRLVDKEYYCEDCHFTWPRVGVRPSRIRPHAAPYYFIDGMERPAPSPTPGPGTSG